MSEAVHEIAHEATHDAAHSGTGHAKLIGLLISILALFLAVSEMLGKSAQTHGLTLNIQASDTWNFYQAKTIRQTVLRAALDGAKAGNTAPSPEAQKQYSTWQSNIDRWESEPDKGEGRKELLAKAQDMEHHRDEALAKYHAYEVASLIIQLGIVLASVSLLSSIMAFAYGSAVLGACGLVVLIGAYSNFEPLMHVLH
ncbi:MAG: DUF4337 domain-containing protein [Methylobacteriaceae bacterium]|nr:DUF4337 domain-containing protein [Methylobacteriaceae bacterium]